jgi:hypothetical protein
MINKDSGFALAGTNFRNFSGRPDRVNLRYLAKASDNGRVAHWTLFQLAKPKVFRRRLRIKPRHTLLLMFRLNRWF